MRRISISLLVLLALTGVAGAECCPDPCPSPTPVVVEPAHICGTGNKAITIRTREFGYNGGKASCGYVSTYKRQGKVYEPEKLRDTWTTVMWGSDDTRVSDIVTCVQEFMYTDYPECGGEHMYPTTNRVKAKDCEGK
jgi:hypothetical protein